jgi:hypothetical protein
VKGTSRSRTDVTSCQQVSSWSFIFSFAVIDVTSLTNQRGAIRTIYSVAINYSVVHNPHNWWLHPPTDTRALTCEPLSPNSLVWTGIHSVAVQELRRAPTPAAARRATRCPTVTAPYSLTRCWTNEMIACWLLQCDRSVGRSVKCGGGRQWVTKPRWLYPISFVNVAEVWIMIVFLPLSLLENFK